MGYGGYADEAHNHQTATGPTSTGLGITTVGGCFRTGEENLRLDPNGWHSPENAPADIAEDQRWLGETLPVARALSELLPVRCVFSHDAEVVNAFLEKEGFSIKLDPLEPEEYGMASVLKLALTWAHTGRQYPITGHDGTLYVGAKLQDPDFAYLVQGHAAPIAMIDATAKAKLAEGQADDGRAPVRVKMMLTELGEQANALEGPALFRAAQTLHAALGAAEMTACEGVEFPAVAIDIEPSLDWTISFHTKQLGTGRDCRITQAKQQLKFAMDHLGATVEEATAVAVAFESSRNEPVQIRGTYLAAMIVQVDGVERVALVLRLAPDAFTVDTATAAVAEAAPDAGQPTAEEAGTLE